MKKGENQAPVAIDADKQGLDTDDLKWLLERNSSYIRDADTKNGITLAIVAVIASILFSSEAFISSASKTIIAGNKVGIILLLAMMVSAAFTMLCVFLSLKPRVKNSKKSLLFYGDISGVGDSDLLHTLFASGAFDLRTQLESQIMETSRICCEKMAWHARADWSLMVLVVAMILYVSYTVLIGG